MYMCDNRMGTGLVDRWPGYVYIRIYTNSGRVTRGIYIHTPGLQSDLDSPAAAD